MFGDNAARCSTAPISSQMDDKRLEKILSSMPFNSAPTHVVRRNSPQLLSTGGSSLNQNALELWI